jgi:O-antigen ligase
MWAAYDYLFLIPAALLGGLALAFLARDELYLLCAILGAFAVVSGYEAGFQLEEALYGVLYLSYLAYWFASRFFFYRDHILRSPIDVALFLFLLYVTASFGLTFVLGGDPILMISEWLSLTMISFYFPAKELIRRDPRAPKALLLTLAWIALFIVLRNYWIYQTDLSSAEALWQIAVNRVPMNEHVLMMGTLGTLVFWLYTKGLSRLVLLGLFMLLLGGVVIGQSRSVWVSTLLGVVVIFFMIDRVHKVRLLLAGGIAGTMLIGFAYFFLEDVVFLVLGGLIDRFSSLETAASQDISLINRFVEAGAAWEAIKQNPLLGHGFGVSFRYYSLVKEFTYETSFVHNGYVGVLYRHGLVGFVLLFTYYLGSIWRGLRLWFSQQPLLYRLMGLIVVACLVAESLVGNTENPFATSEKTLMIGLLGAMASASQGVSFSLRPTSAAAPRPS